MGITVCSRQRVLVNVLLHGILVAVGNGNELFAEDEPGPLDGGHHGHVDNIGAVDAQELRLGQIVLQLLHVHQAHNALAVLQVEAHIVLQALDVENLVEGNADELVVALDEEEAVLLHVLLAGL